MKRLLPVLSAAVLSACVSSKPKGPERGTRPSEAVMQAALADTLNPQSFGLTIYRSAEGPVFTDTNRTHPAQEDLLEFADKTRSLPVVKWETRERAPVFVLFDTRSPRSWVEFGTAQQLRFRPLGPTPFAARARHVTDDTDGYMALVPSLDFGAVRMESVLWHVRPMYGTLGPVGRGITKPEPLVVVGADFMRAFAHVRFDFLRRQVSFATDLAYRPNKLHVVADLPFKLTPGGIQVDGLIDEYRGPVLLDTAGDYDLAMTLTEGSTPLARQVTLGNFARRNVPVNDAEFLGLPPKGPPSIGNRLLDGLVVTLDFETSRVTFEAAPDIEPRP